MNILSYLETASGFTPAEKNIAKWILNHAEEAAGFSTGQIEMECHVSRAGVYRFIAKCGCTGLQNLISQVVKDYPEWKNAKNPLDYDCPFKKGDSPQAVADSIASDYIQSVLMTKGLLDLNDLQEASKKLNQANRILIFTTASNLPVARSFRFQMEEIGKTVLVPEDEYEQRMLAAQIRKDDFVILITFAARGLLASYLMDRFNEAAASWLLISSASLEKKDTGASYQLILPSAESHTGKISSFSLRISLMYLLDLLYSEVFEEDYDRNVQLKNEIYSVIAIKEKLT